MNYGELIITIVELCNKDQMNLKDAVEIAIEEKMLTLDELNSLWFYIFSWVSDDGDEDTYYYTIKKDEE